MSIANVVSFSGGRTSAYLVHCMERMRKAGEIDNVHYVFMDTGAEHPATYDFIRQVVKHYGIKLHCIRAVLTPEKGIGPKWREVSLDEIGPDLQPWKDMLECYGRPSPLAPFCTARMKTEPNIKFCKETFGEFVSWLGIRIDEPRRIKQREGIRYLAEISPMEKRDILAFWRTQPFDLQIQEHLGNCVFCIKKSTRKVALAITDEPKLADQFIELINLDTARILPKQTEQTAMQMYRGYLSFETIQAQYEGIDREHIRRSIRGMDDTDACSESCEAMLLDQMDMFKEF